MGTILKQGKVASLHESWKGSSCFADDGLTDT